MLSGGAGDLFFGVLNASCCALGFRMFYNRDILSKNLVSPCGFVLILSLVYLSVDRPKSPPDQWHLAGMALQFSRVNDVLRY